MKRSAVIAATIVAFAFTGCSTIRQYDLAPHGKNETPTTVVEIGTALSPLAPSIDSGCLSGQDCTPVGQPVPTTTVDTTPGEPPCEDGQPAGICNYPTGYRPPVTVPDTTPVPACDGNVTGECS